MAAVRVALVSLLVVLGSAPSARAVASLDAGAEVCNGGVLGCIFSGPGEGGGGAVFTGASGVGAAQSEGSGEGDPRTISLYAGAAQDYGVFLGRVDLLVDTPYSNGVQFWRGGGTGITRDTWTITAPGASGTGTFRAFFTVNGSIASVPGPGPLTANLRIAMEVNDGLSEATGPIVASGIYGFALDGDLSFSFGVPFAVETTSYLSASIAAPSSGGPFFASVIADFSGGAYLSAIEVYDSQGQLVEDFTITTESGIAYPVPEPAALASASIALLALAGLARRA